MSAQPHYQSDADFAVLLDRKSHRGADTGFDPLFMPECLYEFQVALATWACRKGRGALFADCGLGKTPMEQTWAENVARHTDRPVLILTPLAVGPQMVEEGEKFGVEVTRSKAGEVHRITVANYERLHLFNPLDFAGVVCDESSILKSFDGARQHAITQFMKRVPYRLLATATAAPNDYIELGTSSEALGYLGTTDVLNRFFKNDLNNSNVRRMYGEAPKWRFKGHAETPFWRWTTSWARACRKPSDLGFDDGPFVLPPLSETQHLVSTDSAPDGMLFAMPAADLHEQRREKRRTVGERCEKVAELVDTGKAAVVWCQLNDEGDLLEQLIPGAVQVSGADSDERKEQKFRAFAQGEARVLITKPKIGAWGLNWQHCDHVCYFPSHSYEQYYQAVRRCWRFGQKNAVRVDIPLTEGERLIMANLSRKAEQAEAMFANLVAQMNDSMAAEKRQAHAMTMEVPAWLA